MQTSGWKGAAWHLLLLLFMPAFFLAAALPSRRRKTLFWGPEPVIGYRDWSSAVKRLGHASKTLMSGFYSINKESDFDLYYTSFVPRFLPHAVRFALGSCLALIHVLRRGRIVHMSFLGFILGRSPFWRFEKALFRLAGIKTVLLPFGGDVYQYSTLADPTLRHGLLASYPLLARSEWLTARKVAFWSIHGDVVLASFMIDGIGRWDVTTPHIYIVDTERWQPKQTYSDSDGLTGAVRILHAPNHRGVKGTEFIIEAVEKLKSEGLKVELVLLEKVPNDQINKVMQDVDILAEQLVIVAYGINAMEGMASGLPVLANLDVEFYTRLFRRYAFLNQCPILSTTHETILENLRTMVRNPRLREQLGRAGRAYAERYHSFATAQYLFGSIYNRIIDGEEVDLINLYHPLLSPYVRSPLQPGHPLVENRLPDDWQGARPVDLDASASWGVTPL